VPPVSGKGWHDGLVQPKSRRADRPALITEAPVNVDDEFDRRRKRYLIMMIIRALCIIGAASTFQFSGWLAAGFIVAAAVLPWCAVLIANDRPPKQEVRFRRFLGAGARAPKELTAAPAKPFPNAEDDDADGPATGNAENRNPRIIDL
jgi:hypothetical protein